MEATQSNNSNQRVKQVTKKHVTDTSILADSSKHIEQNTLYCQNSLTTNKLKVMQHDKEFISPCGGRLSSNATNPMISKNRTKFSKNSIQWNKNQSNEVQDSMQGLDIKRIQSFYDKPKAEQTVTSAKHIEFGNQYKTKQYQS